jgi:hypothetical protein
VSEPSLLKMDPEEVIDHATMAMVIASNEARCLAEGKDMKLIARSADMFVYEPKPMESCMVREGQKDCRFLRRLRLSVRPVPYVISLMAGYGVRKR